MSPGDLELRLGLEEGVGDAQVVEGAKLEQSLAIVVHLADSKLSKARGPCVVIGAHSGVEVTQEDQLFLAGDTADGGCKLVVKFVLGVRCGR